jgi:hypothetical protein
MEQLDKGTWVKYQSRYYCIQSNGKSSKGNLVYNCIGLDEIVKGANNYAIPHRIAAEQVIILSDTEKAKIKESLLNKISFINSFIGSL